MKNITLLCLTLLWAPLPSAAQDISANVGLSSDYVFRGISQTNEDPAIQGGFDFAFGTFYIGTWASNIDFGGPGSSEIDIYLGFSHESGGVTWDVGVLRYIYPSQSELDYNEVYVGFSTRGLGFKAYYSDDFAGIGDAGTYLEGSYEVPLTEKSSFFVGVGYSTFGGDVLLDYYDYKAGISFQLPHGLGLGLTYTDTDLPSDDPLASLADGRLVLSLSKEM